MASTITPTQQHAVVSHAEWLAARKELLAKEKEFTHLRDQLTRQRLALPWEKVEKNYVFDGPNGKVSLADLFNGRNQLIIYHFMFGAGWAAGCPSCSYLADHFDGPSIHLANRDVTLAVISHAPYPQIQAFQQRMGWKFPWVSSAESDLNYDFHVSFSAEQRAAGKVDYNYEQAEFPSEEAPGLSTFIKDADGTIYHAYSTYARGLDIFVGAYNFLDHTPKGRDEEGLVHSMSWVRHHDRYDQGYAVDPKQTYVEIAKAVGSCCSGEQH